MLLASLMLSVTISSFGLTRTLEQSTSVITSYALFTDTFPNVKTHNLSKYANPGLDWMEYIPAQGQFHRYKGVYILTETDIRPHIHFTDAVVQNNSVLRLYYPNNEKYDFRLNRHTDHCIGIV